MSIEQGKDSSGSFYRWSDEGNKYYYTPNDKDSREKAKLKASKQGRIIQNKGSNVEINTSSFNIEVNEKEKIVGRLPITLAFHEIYETNSKYNANGICWTEENVENNMTSAIGMPIVVSFLDDDKDVVTGHGTKVVSEDGTTWFENSEVVGTISEAFITEINVDGESKKVFAGKGFVYSQRYPNFTNWLIETSSTEQIKGSVEVAVSKYKDDFTGIGRTPENYQYTGHALLYTESPADDSAIMIELNQLKIKDDLNKNIEEKENTNMQIIKGKCDIEINSKSFDDIGYLVIKAFNEAMRPSDYHDGWYYEEFYIHKIYADKIITKKYGEPAKYYMAEYTINGYTVSLGEIKLAEDEWVVTDSKEIVVEVSSLKGIENIKNKDSKKGGNKMDETQLLELNTKIKDQESKINELNQVIVDLNKTIETNSTTITEKDSKITTLESEINTITEKVNTFESEKLVNELNTKLDIYSDEEKNVCKEKIETFTKTPSKELMSEIVNEINSVITNKVIEARKNKITETNSKNKAEDIYGDIVDVETNSKDTIEENELF
jgi:uncharacterized coiled-coil protein SlyX